MYLALGRRLLKRYTIKLPRKGDYLYLAAGVLVFRFSFEAPLLIVPLIGYLGVLYRLNPSIFRLVLIVSGMVFLHGALIHVWPVTVPTSGVIVDVQETKHTFKTDAGTFYLYIDTDPLKKGSVLHGEFRLLPESKVDLIGGFDQVAYGQSQRIKGTLYSDDFTAQEGSLRPDLKTWIVRYIDTQFDHLGGYMTAFILGRTADLDDAFMTEVRLLGIAHIFALSGLHIGLIAVFLEGGLRRLGPKKRFVIITSVLLLYMALTDFSVSLVRASLMYIFLKLNTHYRFGFTAIDGLSILVVLSLIIHPHVVYDRAFLLSYSVTMMLLLMAPILKKKSAPLNVSILAFMTTLPIIMGMSGAVNLSSIFLNILAVLALSFILLPLSYLTFALPFIEPLITPIFRGFEVAIQFLYANVYWPISVPFTFGWGAFMYYGILILGLVWVQTSWWKLSVVSISLITLFQGAAYVVPVARLTMLDVDGDAFLFQAPFNQCNVVIDGGKFTTEEALKTHLKNHGVLVIDYVIMSHDDADHSDGIKAILNDSQFHIEHFITPLNMPQKATCNDVLIDFYEPRYTYPTKNNQSIVMSLSYQTWTMLFTGDIEQLREGHMETLTYTHYDFLKVSHHGSKTSTSDAFLDLADFEYALINTPQQNPFNFPHPEVVERLKSHNMTIFRSDETGTLTFYLTRKHLFYLQLKPH